MSIISDIGVNATAKKKYLVILICLCIIAPLLLGGWIFAGPKTIREVYINYSEEKGSFQNYKNGDTVWLYGKITDLTRYNTTYGNYMLLTLDDTPRIENQDIGVFVRAKSSYHIGSYLSITLHFRIYHYNNDTLIAAEELFTPLYSNVFVLESIIDGVGWVSGIKLVPMPTSVSMEYTIYLTRDPQRMGYPLDQFSFKLNKGSHYWHEDILDLQSVSAGGGSNFYGNTLDKGENLSGPSLKGIIEFKDIVNPGMLNTGDKIVITCPPITNKYKLDSYVFTLASKNGIVGGTKYFVVGHLGVLEYPSGLIQDRVQLSLVNETNRGNNWKEVFRINNVPGVFAPYHHDLSWYSLDNNYGGLPTCGENGQGHATLKNGVVCQFFNYAQGDIIYQDVNHNDIVDSLDEIIVNWTQGDVIFWGLPEWQIELHSSDEGITSGSISWLRGLGVITGNSVFLEYNVTKMSSDNVSISINKIYGIPGIRLTNISEHGQFKAALFENGSMIFNSTVVNGTIGDNNETSLSFIDVDANGVLDTGDRFNVTCRLHTDYRISLDNRHGKEPTEISWRT